MTPASDDDPEAIPTPDDWGTAEERESWGLDEEHAYACFGGRSFAEAQALLTGDRNLGPLCDLYFVPPRCFPFYIRALAATLQSDDARGDAQTAGSFLRVLTWASEVMPDALRSVWPRIEPVVTWVVEHPEFYEPDWAIDGDFRSRAREIAERGFPVSFSTEFTEFVPREVTPERAATWSSRSLPWVVAAQVWRNAGVRDLPLEPTRADIVRVFGPPSAARADGPEAASIPDWVRYDSPEYNVHISFHDDGQVHAVMFNRPEEEFARLMHQSRAWLAQQADLLGGDVGG